MIRMGSIWFNVLTSILGVGIQMLSKYTLFYLWNIQKVYIVDPTVDGSYAQLIRGNIYMCSNRGISYDRLDRLIGPVMGAICYALQTGHS
ncbi:hypothetical protein VN97_g9385 [Penicillium thymicola]|uniref:Uncharacterized protein n=1 Tax=Penicillium thymicola TaxID=293382 RepID=A0AAI9TBR3_PENTH|nr:hypothetical protein VN97_g9385 [Penicillium thymicola]